MTTGLEQWKDILGYEGLYQVSNLGRVRSISRIITESGGEKRHLNGRILKQSLCNGTHFSVPIRKNLKMKMAKVHLLVWDAFGSEKRDGFRLQVDHKNNISTDNRFCNLQLLTARDNCIKAQSNKKDKSSSYTGVSFNKAHKKWQVFIRIDGKNINLGEFINEEDGSIAYQEAYRKLQVAS